MIAKVTLLILLPLILYGCFPAGPDEMEETGLVATMHDTSFDFKKLHTYALGYQIVKITGNAREGEEVEFIDEEYAFIILEDIQQHMARYGWQEVSTGEEPEIIILVAAANTTSSIWYYDSWYWGWYYPYNYWGWYYPYPIYGGTYSTGTVVISMTYPAGMTASKNIPVEWTAILNGLLDATGSQLEKRSEKAVRQAFDQSPYLDLDDD